MPDKIEKSSGNIFADLGLDDAGQMLAKAKLASFIIDEIDKRGLTQNQAAKLFVTDQSHISRLQRGHEFQRFTFV